MRKLKIDRTLLTLLVSHYILLLNLLAIDHMSDLPYIFLGYAIVSIVLLFISFLPKFFVKTLYILFLFITSLSIFYRFNYHIVITSDILLSGLINDIKLSLELINAKLIIWIIASAILPSILLISISINRRSLKKTLIVLLFYSILAATIAYFNHLSLHQKGQIRNAIIAKTVSLFSPIDTINASIKALKSYRLLQKEYKNAQPIQETFREIDPGDKLVVIVIGESARSDRFATNGYTKNTTPLLSNTEHLYSFRHMHSCDTLTINSLGYIFTPLECKDDKKIKTQSFVSVFRSFGYKTEIISLQTLSAFYRFLGYDKLTPKYQILAEQKNGANDISLLPYINKSISEYHKGKKLLIIHTLGSHANYKDRINPQFYKYTPACKQADIAKCTKETLDNIYDNTIVQTDYVLNAIIRMLHKKKALLFYFSDHGESLGENGIYMHGMPRQIAPKEQFMTPFMIWMSDKYSLNFSHQSIQKKLGNSYDHSYLMYTILGCAAIESSQNNLNLCGQ
jgi:KDO II ethanolaminephosphotransferase